MNEKSGSSSYVRVQRMGGAPRNTEARALIEATRRLFQAQKSQADGEEFRAALAFNLRLWNVFANDLTSPTNQLPADLKGNLMTLFRFVDQRTARALRERKAPLLDTLISINRNVAQGLTARPDETPSPPPSTGAPPASR